MNTLSDAAEGDLVVDINDDRIGVVAQIEGNTVYVEFQPSVVATIQSQFDLTSIDGTTYPLHEEMVDHVGDEFIRMRGDHATE